MFLSVSYLLALVASFFMLGHIVIGSRRHSNMHFVFFCMLVSISLFGYYTISIADTLAVAVVGIQLIFVGRAYICFSALLILYTFCGERMKLYFSIPVGALCTITVFSTLTIGKLPLFYVNPVLVKIYGYSYVAYEYGPLYYLFIAQTAGIFGLFLAKIVSAKCQDNHISKSNCNRIFAIMLVGVVVFLAQTALGPSIMILPYAYLIMEIMIISMVKYMNMHDIESNMVSHMLKQNDYGYIFVDMKRRFLGSNHTALQLLPQLEELRIEHPFKSEKLPVTMNMNMWMDELDKMTDTHSFVRRIFDDERTLKCKVRPLHYGSKGKQVGYTIIISDDTQQQKYINLLNNYNTSLEQEVQSKVSHIADMRDHVLLGIANIVENRDFSTGDHVKRTSHTVRLFLEYLRKERPEVLKTYDISEEIWKAAPMHDLGKLAIRDYILQKPGVYTTEEYEEMKLHSEKGAKIVKEVFEDIEDPDFVNVAINIAHYHHEKWDGTGYPSGLRGEDIPVEARIMALADVFDALVSERCYKTAMSYDEAFEVINKSLGSHFDPVLGKCFTECRRELIHLYEAEAVG